MTGHPNLKLRLPLDGDSNDYSGNGKNGTLVGSPSYAAGVIGQEISLVRASSQAVAIGAVGAANTYNVPYSLFCRAYLASASIGNGEEHYLMGNGHGAIAHGGYWVSNLRLYRLSASDLRLWFTAGRAQGSNAIVQSGNLHGLNTWLSICCTDDGATGNESALKLYIAGVSSPSTYQAGNPRTVCTAYDNWQIGRTRANNGTFYGYATTTVDEAMIYNYKLEAAEALRLTSLNANPLARS